MHALFLSGAFLVILSSLTGVAGKPTPAHADGIQSYTRSHSLGENYTFDPRDGWLSVNVTNLQYKYRRDLDDSEHSSGKHRSGVSGVIKVLDDFWKGLKGIGNPQPVTITWYTGVDLQGPSCWSKGNWAPTDKSFACALTLNGWVDRPKCFQFLELCNSKRKCIFVRVIDTCAGCARGSKHVDLTKAAFKELYDLDVGVATVQMRRATDPIEWFVELWGPKHY
ncbi:hypothetical protein NP233_g2153 [Leucocoprinus birnbaumii]|uniref:RlpA-like protein double-psi beta-barrel domain-containing protein n=1 Tax=Leucocoprinus birnbaumii TaxID=56174 RepID=A0AAD5W2T6_9AGAR|nr:hypothetical protein NP233_g2153 [Leucocoprinus birnbaumii]